MKAVLFDLDDTLFDHTTSATKAVHAWVSELDGTPSDELLAQWFEIEHRSFEAWLAGTFTHQGQRRARLREFLPLLGRPVPGTEDEQDAAFEGYLAWYRRNWAAFDDARPAMEVARSNGWRIGVLTNGSTPQQNAKLEQIGLADLVDVVCTSQSLGYSKPAVEAYRLTCEALGVEPAETLMIGDNFDLDVLGARAAGLTAEHLDRAAGITLTQLIRSAGTP
ncbi:putative hydrolase of the HAD superfamily [Kribbella voronezhensis]|uniref:Putative hydrolase of the HAD superfamily n=1 Tax=Kribbella voronezhensis TaxID=2512212 RepID=A0A4R7TEZ4_9ACTN|nr:HAD family hydrolase [Kribbella voronezhensis]TDU90735.1 putative hydrolase of the HAD superfamily [Kribbella voronezhensis]